MGETFSVSKIKFTKIQMIGVVHLDIEIYVSDDLLSWGSPVWTGDNRYGDGGQESGSFSAEGRYVKLVSLSTSSQQRLYEVEVETVETRGTVEFNPVELETLMIFRVLKM